MTVELTEAFEPHADQCTYTLDIDIYLYRLLCSQISSAETSVEICKCP